ncbi:DEAD/DEAH box helicase family protein [Escherichia sp. SP-MK2]
MLRDKAVPVTALSLTDLEQSALDWSQFDFDSAYKPVMKAKKQLRPHQTPALEAVKRGLATADRGKLIMACGTGKTFTSLSEQTAKHLRSISVSCVHSSSV